MKRCKVFGLVLLVLSSGLQADIQRQPLYEPLDWSYVKYDKARNVFVDSRQIPLDNIVWLLGDTARQQAIRDYHGPRNIPVKTKLVWRFSTNLFATKRSPVRSLPMVAKVKRRLVLVNVEELEGGPQYRAWPHLGLLYVGTVADEEGWEVVLWDELVQGHIPLDKLLQPGDVFGLSLVITGMERGVNLARQAKELGAACVIAGNDAAIFRAGQVLNLPGKPIDAVFTSNSLVAVRRFLREIVHTSVESLKIPDVQVTTGESPRSNEQASLLVELKTRQAAKTRGQLNQDDLFVIPKFELYSADYLNQVWTNFRSEFGHKYPNPTTVRNALALLAHGCTRTRGTDACSYCTIFGVADIRVPSREYLLATAELYRRLGIDVVFNVTDSSYEMAALVNMLKDLGISFPAMQIYGRAQGIAQAPHLLEKWLTVSSGRLRINVGMDSGDDRLLNEGVIKSSQIKGSRLDENRRAVQEIKKSGAHLHYSLIFGSPGESIASCERTVDFVHWTIDQLGDQLDICETDIYWLNFGAPAARIFRDYHYACELAAKAGKTISAAEWWDDFAQHREALVVPWSVEQAWYRRFTHIDVETAQAYNQRCSAIMSNHQGSIHGRAFKPA